MERQKEKAKSNTPEFQKTSVPCLYRYSSNGVYFALIKFDGKQIRASLKSTNFIEAKRKLVDFRRDIGKVDNSKGRLTLQGLVQKYLNTLGNQANKTLRRKSDIAARLLRDFPKGKKHPIDKITLSDLQTWLAKYKFGPPSSQLYIMFLKALFGMAVEDRILINSPAEKLSAPKRSRPIRHTPTVEEFNQIVAMIRSEKYSDTAKESADFIEFLGLAGLGQFEASSLCWRDVNFRLGHIVVFRQKTRTGFSVPIFPQLRPLLERRLQQTTEQNDGRQPTPETSFFSVADAKKSLSAACRKLGFANYSSRAFRRMFITRAIEQGVDVKAIASWQGHVDGGKLILDTYSHVRPAHSLRMAELVV
jgi:integrase